MTRTSMAILTTLAFLIPVPLLAWLDRPPKRPPQL